MTDQVEEVKQLGAGPEGVVTRWLRELELASRAEKDWREYADKVVTRYRGDNRREGETQTTRADAYNLLYSNVQTIGPILYNSTPEPVVERRFDNEDPLAKAASEVLRRAIKYAVGCQDFDEVLSLAVQDYQLPGRAVVSVQYVPTLSESEAPAKDQDAPATEGAGPQQGPETTGAGDPQQGKTEELVYEEIRFDLTPWRSFRRGPGRTWQDVPWIAFELDLPREKCIELFGKEIGEALPLRAMQDTEDRRPKEEIDREVLFARARVWQIWSKNERKVYWISPDYKEQPCKVADDEYNLSGFFNVPRPLYAVETSDSLVPVAEFKLYETLANEAETIVNRMAKIVRMIRVRWAFDGSLPEIETMMESAEGKGTPVKNAQEWAEKGGLTNAVWMWPIDMLVKVYESLSIQLDRVKGEVFEVLGVADIMRGTTDPNETATAQTGKMRWGSIRTRRRQAEVQRFCRDLFRIAGELIAEKFSAQTLAMMTGLQYPYAQQKQAVQQVVQQVQQNPQMAQQITPETQQQAQAMLALPSWEDIVGFLRNDAMRHFRIDIQTDSTIALQEQEDQADFAQMMKAVTDLFASISPMVQGGILPFDVAKAMLTGLTRKYRLGYDVEDKLAQMKAPTPPDPNNSPDAIKAKAKAEADSQVANTKAQASIAIENARAQADVQINAHEAEMKANLAAQKASIEAQGKSIQALPGILAQIIVQELKNVGALGVARVTAGLDAGQSLLDHEEALAEQQQAAALAPPPQRAQ